MYVVEEDSLAHYGVPGMKWGVRKDKYYKQHDADYAKREKKRLKKTTHLSRKARNSYVNMWTEYMRYDRTKDPEAFHRASIAAMETVVHMHNTRMKEAKKYNGNKLYRTFKRKMKINDQEQYTKNTQDIVKNMNYYLEKKVSPEDLNKLKQEVINNFDKYDSYAKQVRSYNKTKIEAPWPGNNYYVPRPKR